jgi:hypothetical protein
MFEQQADLSADGEKGRATSRIKLLVHNFLLIRFTKLTYFDYMAPCCS